MNPDDLASLGVDASQIVIVFAWGFSAVFAFAALGFLVGIAVAMVKKI